MTRPTTFPDWATGGGAVVVQPDSDKQAAGWVDSELPPAGFMNWLQNENSLWLRYLDAVGNAAFFGTGADGAANFNGGAVAGCSGTGPYTLTRDVHYTNATIAASTTVNTNGFRFYWTGLLDMSAANCVLACDGAAGSGVTGGAAQTGILGTLYSGQTGSGPSSNGVNATNAVNALGGAGGAGGTGTGGAPSGPATVTKPVATLGYWLTPPAPWTGILTGISGGVAASTLLQGGAGGGGAGGAAAAFSGGGGGAPGGVLIASGNQLNLSTTAILGARGGAGGNATGNGGGGGGGGGGGAAFVNYRSVVSGSQTVAARVSVAGGAGGIAPSHAGGATDGGAGSAGNSYITQL